MGRLILRADAHNVGIVVMVVREFSSNNTKALGRPSLYPGRSRGK